MYIMGIGTIGVFGLGKNALLKVIKNNNTVTSCESLEIDLKNTVDKSLFKNLRRADRFTKLAVASVDNALKNNRNSELDCNNTGIIVATAFGPHNTTFSFLDELIEFGDKNVSPIKFSNSVHNAAGSYITQLFSFKGPASTVTNFKSPVEEAFRLAYCWIHSEMCENVILCTVDEKGEIFDKAFKMIADKSFYPSEGSCCFILSKKIPEAYYASVSFDINSYDKSGLKNKIYISPENKILFNGNELKSYSQYCGNMIISKAFDLAAEIAVNSIS